MQEKVDFKNIVLNQHQILRELKNKSKKKIFLYFSPHTPEEIFHSFGIHTTRIVSSKKSSVLAHTVFENFSCSWLRDCISQNLSGELEYMDGVVFPTGMCDSIRNLYSLWTKNMFSIFLPEPVKMDERGKKFFFQKVLEVVDTLEIFTGKKFSKRDLKNSIRILNKNREYLRKFRNTLPYSEFFYLVTSSQILPKETFNELMKNLKGRKKHGIPLFLIGNVVDFPEIFGEIENLGGNIVSDDLCFVSHYFDFFVEVGKNPVKSIVDGYLEKIPNPTKFDSERKREKHIFDTLEKYKVEGVIFLLQKYCESYFFDYVSLKKKLEERGIKTLLIEIENKISNMLRIKTNIKAFLEILR